MTPYTAGSNIAFSMYFWRFGCVRFHLVTFQYIE